MGVEGDAQKLGTAVKRNWSVVYGYKRDFVGFMGVRGEKGDKGLRGSDGEFERGSPFHHRVDGRLKASSNLIPPALRDKEVEVVGERLLLIHFFLGTLRDKEVKENGSGD